MWTPDQWKVNKGKLVTRRSQSSTIAPRYRIQDSLGFWIPLHLFYSGFRVLDFSLFQWNLDSRCHSLVGYLISILDSKALDSGFHRNNFPGFRILQAKIFQTPESGYQSNIFWPVHAYLIKQWEIYFSSNVRFYNSGAPARAKRARSGAPWVRKFGKLSIPENLVMT